MKLVTAHLLAATCSAFALDDGPIFECDREWYAGFMAISRRRDAEAAQRAVVQADFDAENAQIAAKRAAEEASAEASRAQSEIRRAAAEQQEALENIQRELREQTNIMRENQLYPRIWRRY
jgi:hypothetical protein